MKITVGNLHFKQLNQDIRQCKDNEIILEDVRGQRYIGCGLAEKSIRIHGVPGNALGSYLVSGKLTVYANAQDAVGDTMNGGEIVIHGNSGDTTGYAMRGGQIYIRGNAGYRVGIHMKEYQNFKPVIVVGGRVGSFLGEYQAGGIIVVLGIDCADIPVGNFCGTGMHGGKIFLRTHALPQDLPAQISAASASQEDLYEIEPYLNEFCGQFNIPKSSLMDVPFYKLTPNSNNPYKQLYVQN